MKKILILTIPLMLLFAPAVFACAPLPPPPEGCEYGQYMGPDITGTLTFVSSGENSFDVTFDGQCKNNSVVYDGGMIIGLPFDIVTAEWLLGTCETCTGPQMLGFPIPYDCTPKNKNFNLSPVVYKVVHFFEDGTTTKVADIVGRWVVIICP